VVLPVPAPGDDQQMAPGVVDGGPLLVGE
jgi:hypothetical protein